MKFENDFIIFIISHERAETMTTYKLLQKMQCKYPIYIVIDNEDKQKELYEKKYSSLIVFDKNEYLEKTDTIDNFKKKTSAVYARNFCIDKAKEMKKKYFAIFDDDITDIRIRYPKDGKLASFLIKDITKVIDIYVDFLEKSKCAGTGFGQTWGLIGGIETFFNGGQREICQTMILKNSDFKYFAGTQNEDGHFSYANFDKVFYKINGAIITSPERGTNEGGNNDFYNNDFYITNFYSIIYYPSALKINLEGKIRRQKKYIYPEILSSRWKK